MSTPRLQFRHTLAGAFLCLVLCLATTRDAGSEQITVTLRHGGSSLRTVDVSVIPTHGWAACIDTIARALSLRLSAEQALLVLDEERSELRSMEEWERGQALFVEVQDSILAAEAVRPQAEVAEGSPKAAGDPEALPGAVPSRFGPSRSSGQMWTFDQLWSTPLYKAVDRQLRTVEAALMEDILARENSTVSEAKSNFLGWQSSDQVFEEADLSSAVQLLQRRLYQHLLQFIGMAAGPEARGELAGDIHSAWFNVNRRGAMNAPHTHESDVSGVYYVSSGGCVDSQLCFRDPRPQAEHGGPAEWTLGSGGTMCIAPRGATVVIFPAWLEHYVLVHTTEQPRVSVSFNAKIIYPGHPPDWSEAPSGLRMHTPARHRQAAGNAIPEVLAYSPHGVV